MSPSFCCQRGLVNQRPWWWLYGVELNGDAQRQDLALAAPRPSRLDRGQRKGRLRRAQLSGPIAVESRVVYLRHSGCSPIYLKHLCGADAVDLGWKRPEPNVTAEDRAELPQMRRPLTHLQRERTSAAAPAISRVALKAEVCISW